MSNMSEILDTLVSAKDALETLPKLREELAYAKLEIDELYSQLRNRNDIIESYSNNVAELNATIRSLEVERDNAMFREAETHDKLTHAMALVNNFLGNVQTFKAAIEPEPATIEAQTAVGPEAVSEALQAPNAEGATSNEPNQNPTLGSPEKGLNSDNAASPEKDRSTTPTTPADPTLPSAPGPTVSQPSSSTATTSTTESTTESSAEPTISDYHSGRATRYYSYSKSDWVYQWRNRA